MSVRVNNVARAFDRRDAPAVVDVSFTAQEGGITTLLGPSGSGKSTLLRIIAGLEIPDDGRVFIDDHDVTELPTQKRNVGFVFQSYALFPTMTVHDNVAFGLSLRRVPKKESDDRVRLLLDRVQLEGFGHRFPSELSGGQRQRVAFARALAIEPRVLLLDEPFGALDTRVRRELRAWLQRLHETVGSTLTTILVTHDQEEALELSQHVIVMNKGLVEQAGAPDVIYDAPITPFVASFVGGASVLGGTIREGRAEIGSLSLESPKGGREGDKVRAFVRAHDVELARAPERLDANAPAVSLGVVERVVRAGATIRLDLRLPDGESLTVSQSRAQFQSLGVGEGDRVFVDLRDATVFLEDYAI